MSLGLLGLGVLFLGFGQKASADVVLSSFGSPDNGFFQDNYLGVGIETGPTASNFGSLTISDPLLTPISPELEIETRNANGTVGATLDTITNFSDNLVTHQLTFTPTTPFTLAANTGYWLVLSDSGLGFDSSWEGSNFPTTAPSDGFSLAAIDDSFRSSADNGGGTITYYAPNTILQLFSLSTTPVAASGESVPLPAPVAGGCMGALVLMGCLAWKKRAAAAVS